MKSNGKIYEIFDPKVDYVFKRIFGHDKDIFIDFVNSIFEDKHEQKIKSVIFENNEIPKDSMTYKASLLDVRATLDDGSHVNIEIQVRDQGGFEKRSLYHWAKLYEQQIESGDDYLMLDRCVCINVLNFSIFEELKGCHNIYGVTNLDTHERFSNDFELHFLELPKLIQKSYDKSMSKLEKWLLFLKAPTDEVLEDLSMHDPLIAKATKTLKYLSQDPEARTIYEARRRHQLDLNTAVHSAEIKATMIEKRETALRLKALGFDTMTIIKATNLTDEEIKSL